MYRYLPAIAALLAPAVQVAAVPAPAAAATNAAAAAPAAAAITGNPYLTNQPYKNPYYSSEVINTAVPSLSAEGKTSLIPKATAAAEVPNFYWIDVAAKIPDIGDILEEIQTANAAGASPPYLGQFVVYDLPDRDCAALASNGEYSIADDGLEHYYAYIDGIVAQLQAYPDVNVVLVIEPDSLANLVTNLAVSKCANAQSAYLAGIDYALENLNLANVAMYIDAGHAGWLGWSANIGPAASLFSSVYANAGSPAAVRGLATNVANYNSWSIATCPAYTSGDANCDEKRYINAIAPLLAANGFNAHFITDTGRDGVQPTSQNAWGDWCNLINTGFGVRPTSNTGDALEDAFVWVKPGGESDGTSDTTSARYDAHCGYSDALQPAPEAGTWFEAYFEQLLTNANPAF